MSQNVLKSDLKKSRTCPIRGAIWSTLFLGSCETSEEKWVLLGFLVFLFCSRCLVLFSCVSFYKIISVFFSENLVCNFIFSCPVNFSFVIFLFESFEAFNDKDLFKCRNIYLVKINIPNMSAITILRFIVMRIETSQRIMKMYIFGFPLYYSNFQFAGAQ